MLLEAGYDLHSQYQSLLFYYHFIAPNLGKRPSPKGESDGWSSYCNDDLSPIEYSWAWEDFNGSPKIRFAMEAIGPTAGSESDPFNQNASRDLVHRLHAQFPDVNLELFDFFWRFLTTSNRDTGPVEARAIPGSHRSSLFLTCELEGPTVLVKAYFLPMLKSLDTNEPRLDLLSRTIQTLNQGAVKFTAFNSLLEFMKTDDLGSQLEIELVAVDCVKPEDARIKIYVRSPFTNFNDMSSVLTLNGQITPPRPDSSLDDLRDLWRLTLGLDEDFDPLKDLPTAHHFTAGMFYCFSARCGDALPVPKLHIPVKHYGRNDASVTQGLMAYFKLKGKDAYTGGYQRVLEEISSHRPLENGRGIHTYIACQPQNGSLRVASYMGPETYFQARYAV